MVESKILTENFSVDWLVTALRLVAKLALKYYIVSVYIKHYPEDNKYGVVVRYIEK